MQSSYEMQVKPRSLVVGRVLPRVPILRINLGTWPFLATLRFTRGRWASCLGSNQP